MMKFPKFKKSKTYINELACDCMVAVLHNSVIPGLARRYISKKRKDPEFDIFLRCKKIGEVSKWHHGILERLFERKELVQAINEGMKEYEQQLDGEVLGGDEASWRNMKQNGFLSHVVLRAIVVDEIKREVILSLSTESDGNLAEHGISICLKKGRWRFHTDDYLNSYSAAISREDTEKRWAATNVPSASPAVIVKNPDFLWGTWEFDEKEARKISKRLWSSVAEMEEDIKSYRGARIDISETRFSWTTRYTDPYEFELKYESQLIGSTLQGDKVKIRIQNLVAKTGKVKEVRDFIWQNNLLIDQYGKLVLKKLVKK